MNGGATRHTLESTPRASPASVPHRSIPPASQPRSHTARVASPKPRSLTRQADRPRSGSPDDPAEARLSRRTANAQATAAIRHAANEAAHAQTLGTAVTTLDAKRKAAAEAARKEADTAAENRRDDEAEVARKRALALTRIGSMTASARPRGQLITPVVGRIVHGWGERTEAGPATGLSFQTPPAARAVAPCGGKVVFADAFRSYGRMVILDCGGGYHAVMAGFERLDVAVGRPVKAGDTVGTMPASDQARTAGRPLLYLELRRDGEPINPAPWLRSRS